MRKYVVYYWLLVVAGIVISVALSSLIHSVLDKPRGVPLASLGIAGTITQIGLMVFPLLFAPILCSFAFHGGKRREPTKKELRYLIATVASTAFILWLIHFAASGAWFGVLQGGVWFVIAYILGPPIVATVAFGTLFPLGNRLIALRLER
jgi:hypothetical protein